MFFWLFSQVTLTPSFLRILYYIDSAEEYMTTGLAGNGQQMKNIWMISREYGELAGAGGVKDVVRQLAEALARWSGRSLHVVLPLYGFMDTEELGFEPLMDPSFNDYPLQLHIDMHQPGREVREDIRFFYKKSKKVHIYLVDALRYQQKFAVYTYTTDDESREKWQKKSMGHHDYFAMNVLLQKAAIELMIVLQMRPDVIHCHDGHTALLPALLREIPGYRSYFRQTGCLVTVHNGGYGYHQEIADIPYSLSVTGLPERVVLENQLDRKFDPFLVAGAYAVVNTVSENYARELQETENDKLTGWLGHELKRRGVHLEGVTNGIDPALFSSSVLVDSKKENGFLFSPGNEKDDLGGKKRFKQFFVRHIPELADMQGVKHSGELTADVQKPLFTFVGRLSEQKGVDTLLEVLPVFMKKNEQAQMVILGNGSTEIESRLEDLARTELRGRLCFLNGFSPKLANSVFAAGDFFVVPSRYEPCGLTDFIAQLFGSIPIVRHVGGLIKVVDDVTGIAYKDEQPSGLFAALGRALELFNDLPAKRTMQLRAVQEIEKNYTWTKVMQRYLHLYRLAQTVQIEKHK